MNRSYQEMLTKMNRPSIFEGPPVGGARGVIIEMVTPAFKQADGWHPFNRGGNRVIEVLFGFYGAGLSTAFSLTEYQNTSCADVPS